MKIKFLGAVGTVTGSRTQIDDNGDYIWIDCGLFQGPKDVRIQNWQPLENINKVKAVILTHAHIDHSGLIPLLVKQGYKGPIYCSEATADLCRILLPDSGFLQEEDARFANQKRYSSHNPALPLYTEEDAVQSLKQLKPQKMNEWIPLSKSLRFRFSRSSHILGSSFVEIGYSEKNMDRIMTFSGDIGQPSSYLLKEPVQIAETDELILESTYGDRSHEKSDRMEALANIINKVIGRKGTLVIPAFAVGRTQELLYMIRRLQDLEKVDLFDVYLDSPMAADTTDLYHKYQDELKPEIFHGTLRSPLVTSRFRTIRSADESMLLCMDDSPKIVISAAGMLTGGRVLHHLKAKLPHKKNGVLFVGYQVPGTKGSLLKNGLNKIRLHHQDIDVEAGIFSMDSLSAHADSNQLVEWVGKFRKRPSKIFLNHGEEIARKSLAYRIRNELDIQCVLPDSHQEFEVYSD